MRSSFALCSAAQTAVGVAGLSAAELWPLPNQALDHASGYLMAFGAMTALHRLTAVGRSWHVEVSLARAALWLRGLGRVPGGLRAPELALEDLMEQQDSGFGLLRAVRPAALLSETPAHYVRPSAPLAGQSAKWPVK